MIKGKSKSLDNAQYSEYGYGYSQNSPGLIGFCTNNNNNNNNNIREHHLNKSRSQPNLNLSFYHNQNHINYYSNNSFSSFPNPPKIISNNNISLTGYGINHNINEDNINVYKVIKDYRAQWENEINVWRNEEVKVLNFNEEYAYGYSLNRKDLIGYFPKDSIRIFPRDDIRKPRPYSMISVNNAYYHPTPLSTPMLMTPSAPMSIPPSAPMSIPPSAPMSIPPSAPMSIPPSTPMSIPPSAAPMPMPMPMPMPITQHNPNSNYLPTNYSQESFHNIYGNSSTDNYGSSSNYSSKSSSLTQTNNERVLSPAEIKELEEEYWSYVQCSCIDGNINDLENLFNDGNNKFDIVNAKTVDGWTTLHIAVFNNQYEIAKCLLEHGSNINAGKDEYTPLYIACQDGHFDIVKLLVEMGANIDKLSNGFTPIHIACQYGHIEIVDYLLSKGANVVVQNDIEGKFHLLHTAVNAEENSYEMIEFLLTKNFDVNVKNSRGMTPLHICAQYNKNEIAKYLINVGKADIECEDNDLNTPLIIAARYDNYDMIELLLKYRIDINCSNITGMTPLHIACENGNLDIVKYLVEMGANIDALTFEEQTSLYYGVFYGNYDIVKYLLDKKPKKVDIEKLINIARRIKNARISELLMNYNSNDSNNYNYSSYNIIHSYPDDVPNSFDEEDDELMGLINAARDNNLPKATNYIELNNGKYLNFVDVNGWTALHWASYLNHIDIVELLIEKGALTHIKTSEGINDDPQYKRKTAREIAKLRNNKKVAKMIRNNIYLKRVKIIFSSSKIAIGASGTIAAAIF